MNERFQCRQITAADAGTVAQHRTAMFRDIGSLPEAMAGEFAELAQGRLHAAIVNGDYVGWIASPADDAERIVAGAGLLVRRVLPFPRRRADGGAEVVEGRQAVILNVYTEPAFRRQGIGRLLMLEVLTWARDHGVESLVLHASAAGRALYESLGFKPTNEMRFEDDLATWRRPSAAPDHDVAHPLIPAARRDNTPG